MKQSFKLLFLLILISIQACTQPDEKSRLITRKWRVTFTPDQLLNTMSKAEREFYKLIPEDIRKKELKSVIETANDNTFEFKADKTFEMVLKGQEIHESGTWVLNKENDTYKLILTKTPEQNSNKKEREELIIKELTAEKMVIIIDTTKEVLLEPIINDKI